MAARNDIKLDDKRSQILAAAEAIISIKGLENTKISDIAQQAGIADSLIYQYFRGKEDLMFSTADARMGEVLRLVNEHLQGIIDARSRISKLIWFHLHHHDTHRGYAGILLFECRSSPNFYKTDAYTKVQHYAALFSDTIEAGINEGLFRSDLDVRLVRDIILGTLDAETISCLGSREIEESVPDLEDIVSLINIMLSKKPEATFDKSDRILLAAEEVFAEKGFAKAKVIDIAKAAHVSEGTVYEYYETKKGLLLSMACNRLKERMDRLSEEFENEHPVQELRTLMRWYFSSLLKDRGFLKIFLLDLQLKKDFYSSCAYRYFKKYISSIENVITRGVARDYFRADVNPRVFRNMVIGAFNHCALRWFIFGFDSKIDKMTEIEDLIDLLSFAVIKN